MAPPSIPYRTIVIGQAIRRARCTRGFTQEDLAALTGIIRTNISKYENGKRLPSLDELYAIADACACSINTILPATLHAPSPELWQVVQTLIDHPDALPVVLQTLNHHVQDTTAYTSTRQKS